MIPKQLKKGWDCFYKAPKFVDSRNLFHVIEALQSENRILTINAGETKFSGKNDSEITIYSKTGECFNLWLDNHMQK